MYFNGFPIENNYYGISWDFRQIWNNRLAFIRINPQIIGLFHVI